MKSTSSRRVAAPSLFRDERGLSTVEYVILLAVIVVGAVSIWNQIGGKFKASLGNADQELEQLSK